MEFNENHHKVFLIEIIKRSRECLSERERSNNDDDDDSNNRPNNGLCGTLPV